ncbi:MAG: flavin-containing monooxygenase, partial [Thermoleophilaceae bacterium]
MAIQLKREGIEDFVVLERGEEVGGTWHYNTYPGCACDVPSHLYSFSFAPNPEWSQTYSPQPEIRAYLSRCADDFGIRPHVRLRTNVESADWNEETQRWDLETNQGPMRARVLIAGLGPLAEPKIPDIPGLEDFQGKTMHSARWDDSYDVTGKRVASIGTGASAIQYVPEIQPKVEQ